MPQTLTEKAIVILRLLLLAVIFASLWIRFVAMGEENRITDSGKPWFWRPACFTMVLTRFGLQGKRAWVPLSFTC